MTIIQVATSTATIEGGAWTSENKDLQTWLNTEMDIQGGFGQPQNPDPDLAAARHMIATLGVGKIVLTVPDEDPDEVDPERVH